MKAFAGTLAALVLMLGSVTYGYSQETVSHEVFWELQLDNREVNTFTERDIDRLSEEAARTLLKSSLLTVK